MKLTEDPAISSLKAVTLPNFASLTYDYDNSYNKYQINPFTNHITANFVTAYGRTKLFSGVKSISSVGHKVLYVDTDSVTFVKRHDNNQVIPNFPLGTELGEWESEADKVYGRRIDEYIALGRKAYIWGGRTPQGIETLKVRTKGIPPHLAGKNVETFGTAFDNLPQEEKLFGFSNFTKITESKESLIVTGIQFQSNNSLTIAINNSYDKKMSCTIRHRRFFNSGLSVPFGSKIKE